MGGKYFSGFDVCDIIDCFVVELIDDGLERVWVVGWREVVSVFVVFVFVVLVFVI